MKTFAQTEACLDGKKADLATLSVRFLYMYEVNFNFKLNHPIYNRHVVAAMTQADNVEFVACFCAIIRN